MTSTMSAAIFSDARATDDGWHCCTHHTRYLESKLRVSDQPLSVCHIMSLLGAPPLSPV